MIPTENGGVGIGIMPWIPFTDDDEVEIRGECLLLRPMEPSQDIRNEYSARFGSGVVTAGKGEIIV